MEGSSKWPFIKTGLDGRVLFYRARVRSHGSDGQEAYSVGGYSFASKDMFGVKFVHGNRAKGCTAKRGG